MLLLAAFLAAAACREAPPSAPRSDVTTSSQKPGALHVYGFEPFGAFDPNPTEAFVRSLARADDRFSASVLSVRVPEARAQLAELLAGPPGGEPPRLVVGLGVRSGLDRLQLNPVGLNFAAVHEAGDDPWAGALDPGLPIELELPADELEGARRALDAARVPYEVSRDAGAHVCNVTLFDGLAFRDPATRFVFLHVPARLGRDPALADALRRALDALAAWAGRDTP